MMRVQCDGCSKADASVMCCADEAALCRECDTQIHAANKLASKHQRVALLHPHDPLHAEEDSPRCDVCQEKTGYFFCLQDRALLCRGCDYSIHSMNALAGKHKRYLVLGIRVELHALTTTSEVGEAVEDGLSSTPQVSAASLTQAKQLAAGHSIRAATQYTIQDVAGSPAGMVCSSRVPRPPDKTSAPTPTEVPKPSHVERAIPCQTAKLPLTDLTQFVMSEHQQPLAQPWTAGGACVLSSASVSTLAGQLPMDLCSDPKMPPSTHSDGQRGEDGFLKKSNIAEYLTEAIPGWTVDELLSLAERAPPTDQMYGSSKKDGRNSGKYSDWPCARILAGEPVRNAEVPSSSSSMRDGVSRPIGQSWAFEKHLDRFLMGHNIEDASAVVPDVAITHHLIMHDYTSRRAACTADLPPHMKLLNRGRRRRRSCPSDATYN